MKKLFILAFAILFCVLPIKDTFAAPTTKKIAYLTFDDGSSEFATPRVLGILEKNNIKATFFVVGKMVEKHPDIFKTLFDNGHSVGLHSYSHIYGDIYASPTSLEKDIVLCENAVKKVVPNFSARLYRFPSGGHNLSPSLKNVPVKLGLKVVGWNAVIGDGEANDRTTATYLRIFKNSVKPLIAKSDDIILLMHDGPFMCATAKALPTIIEFLRENGYVFKAL